MQGRRGAYACGTQSEVSRCGSLACIAKANCKHNKTVLVLFSTCLVECEPKSPLYSRYRVLAGAQIGWFNVLACQEPSSRAFGRSGSTRLRKHARVAFARGRQRSADKKR
eukprot:6190373-Pleurochrysis_carterae.AAC.4